MVQISALVKDKNKIVSGELSAKTVNKLMLKNSQIVISSFSLVLNLFNGIHECLRIFNKNLINSEIINITVGGINAIFNLVINVIEDYIAN